MGLFSKLFKKKDKKSTETVIMKPTEKPIEPNTVDKSEPAKKTANETPQVKATPAKSTQNVFSIQQKKSQTAPPAPQANKSKVAAQKQTPQPKKEKTTVQKQAPAAQKAAEKEPVKKSKIGTGFFEIKKSKDDRYVFNLYASNNVIIATSQVYSSSQSAINGAKSVIENASKAKIEDQTLKNFTAESFPKWEIYKDKAGQFRFRLSASNGSCVCHSQGYTNKANCKNGIESIIRTAANATIDKAYLIKK